MFWVIVLGALGLIAFLGTIFGAGVLWVWLYENPPFGRGIHNVAVGVAGSIVALLICSGLIYALVQNIDDNDSEHCGPGTRYVSESHYNPATKTTITDWMCVAP